MNKILFLDIDGVLNSALDFFEERTIGHPVNHGNMMMNRGMVSLISNVITKTDAKIVFSSSWRDVIPLIEIYNFMVKHDFQHPWECIVGGTPSHRRGFSDNPFWHRGREIKEYIEENEVETFCIVDDHETSIVEAGFHYADLFDESEEPVNFIHTNGQIGLTVMEHHRIINILGLTEYWQEEKRKDDEALAMLASCII